MDSDVRRRLLWVKLYQQTRDAGLVCRRCGISYPTLRKWVGRYREVGEAGLASRSRRPARSPNRRIFEQERTLILNLRTDRKLGVKAENGCPQITEVRWPLSTDDDVRLIGHELGGGKHVIVQDFASIRKALIAGHNGARTASRQHESQRQLLGQCVCRKLLRNTEA